MTHNQVGPEATSEDDGFPRWGIDYWWGPNGKYVYGPEFDEREKRKTEHEKFVYQRNYLHPELREQIRREGIFNNGRDFTIEDVANFEEGYQLVDASMGRAIRVGGAWTAERLERALSASWSAYTSDGDGLIPKPGAENRDFTLLPPDWELQAITVDPEYYKTELYFLELDQTS